MKSMEFVNKAIDIAKNHKTLYVMGCFGAPLTGANVTRYLNNHNYNKQASRQKMIKAAANQSPPVFGFDCVCLMKGIMWGWNGDASRTYGGAGYAINGVPDVNADGMIARCTGVTRNFSNIIPGECVWMAGHVGIYIGNGLAVQCSPVFQPLVISERRRATIPAPGRSMVRSLGSTTLISLGLLPPRRWRPALPRSPPRPPVL